MEICSQLSLCLKWRVATTRRIAIALRLISPGDVFQIVARADFASKIAHIGLIMLFVHCFIHRTSKRLVTHTISRSDQVLFFLITGHIRIRDNLEIFLVY